MKSERKDKSGNYRIVINCCLGREWTEWFGGLTVLSRSDGTTEISGYIKDQSALYGILDKIRNLNFELISLNREENNEKQ